MITTGVEFWNGFHPVLEALRRRRATGDRDDGCKIGLAVEGGGMRGIISAAMLIALEDMGMTDAFDVVYGSSCGALNAAYFLARDSHTMLVIGCEDLTRREFVDFSRPLRGKPIMDVDYVFEELLGRRRPLDYERILASETRLAVAVTAVDRQECVVVQDFEDQADLESALRATAWLPGPVPGTSVFRGERTVDGSVLVTHPWVNARDDACTHILSLSTHPLFQPRIYNPIAMRLATWYLDRLSPGLGEGYRQSLEVNRGHLALLERWMLYPRPDPYVLDIGPLPGAPPVARSDRDRDRILAAGRYSYNLATAMIEGVTGDERRRRLVRGDAGGP